MGRAIWARAGIRFHHQHRRVRDHQRVHGFLGEFHGPRAVDEGPGLAQVGGAGDRDLDAHLAGLGLGATHPPRCCPP